MGKKILAWIAFLIAFAIAIVAQVWHFGYHPEWTNAQAFPHLLPYRILCFIGCIVGMVLLNAGEADGN